MDKQFDELSKSLAEGISRRDVLRKIGVGLAGVLLAVVGLNRRAWAKPQCTVDIQCGNDGLCCSGDCVHIDNNNCGACGAVCPAGTQCTKIKYKVKGNVFYYACV